MSNEITVNENTTLKDSVVERDGNLIYIDGEGVEYPRPANNWIMTFHSYSTLNVIDGEQEYGESLYEVFGGQRVHFFIYKNEELVRAEIYNYPTNSWNHLITVVVDTLNDESPYDAILRLKCMIRAMQQIVPYEVAFAEELGSQMTSSFLS